MARSPIKLDCRVLRQGQRRYCRWLCIAPVRAAEFRSRVRPATFKILHPSTQPGYRDQWQVTHFVGDYMPSGHDVYATCNQAVAGISPADYRLAKVVAGETGLKGCSTSSGQRARRRSSRPRR
jgi:hypothetical protein